MAETEILNVFRCKGRYFLTVARRGKGADTGCFRFGVSAAAYRSLTALFGLRPFDAMPGVRYEYFVVPWGAGRTETGELALRVRIRSGKMQKNFAVAAPRNLIRNMLWIARIRSSSDAAHLSIPEGRSRTADISWAELLRGMAGSIFSRNLLSMTIYR